MSNLRHLLLGSALAAISLAGVSGCESGDYGGSTSSVYYGGAYYPGGYYPGYYPGYPCCYDEGDIIVNPPDRPGNGNGPPDRPTTLPAHPEQLPSNAPSARPAPSTRPAPTASSRPAPRPTPRPAGGGGRRR